MSGAAFGLIEAGGTKFVVGVADATGHIIASTRIATTTPGETISAVIEWLKSRSQQYTGIGIASFGPLDLDPASPTWGYITRTAKPGWSNTDLVSPMKSAFGCPVAINTDVNGAALAEWRWGAGTGCLSSLYLTVGTGIGGGVVVQGKLLHGLSHPEMGHISVPRYADDMGFAGICPFHGDCLEGVASGPAIIARWGASLSELASDHPGHQMIAWYLALAICSFQAVVAPQRIIMGGGVMATSGLIERVRVEAVAAGGGYFMGDIETIVVPPRLGDMSGLKGALALILS